jgi:hypothetical protein
MVTQVPVVSILMMVHGGMLIFMGLLLSAAGPFLFFIAQNDQGAHPPDKTMMSVMAGGYLVYGIVVVIVGVLHIFAGIRCRRFRGRVLALVALFCNLLTLMTCYCMPTSVGMMVYGLIVFFNGDVTRAFAMAARGVSPQEILSSSRPRRNYEEPEDDDEFRRQRRQNPEPEDH